MDPLVLTRQVLLFGHLIAFAFALGEVLRTDVRLVFGPPPGARTLRRAAAVVSVSLALLWATGLGLILLDTGFDPAVLAGKPKLLAKLVVAAALTANGWLLHLFAFPALAGRAGGTATRALLCAILGAVSSVSWLYAAFVGAARLIAPQMTLAMFLGLYGIALSAGTATAVMFVAPRLMRRFARSSVQAGPVPADMRPVARDAGGTAPAASRQAPSERRAA